MASRITVLCTALCIGALAAATAAFADAYGAYDGSRWSHNGSVMYLRIDGSSRRIYYLTPRAGMVAAGARQDSLLFDGNEHSGQWTGSAYVFSGRCKQKYPYTVTGGMRDGTIIELAGYAPHITADCTVDRYGTSNDVLIFTAISSRE
jgi:hypothetical protein